MENTREKLIELLFECKNECYSIRCDDCEYFGKWRCSAQWEADHLIANGVTLREHDCHWATEQAYKNGFEAGKPKWIPVTERLPEDNERVLVYHDDGVIRFGINKDGFADVVSSLYLTHHHRTCFSKVTHWMPLPDPPKEET